MAILRKKKRSNYTVIDNAVFTDCELSLKAKGMLCQMLSLPDYWSFSINGLTTRCKDGKASVMSALNELEEAGYFRREQIKRDGKFAGVEYVVSETKLTDSPYAENQNAENQNAENQHTENPPQLNTNKSITDKSKTNSSITKESLLSEFEILWELYPRKQGKKKALEYYQKARKKGTTFEEVKQGIEAYSAYVLAEKTEDRFIKHGSTFFSEQAWQDDWSINNDTRRSNKERKGIRGTVREGEGSVRDDTPEWYRPFEAFPLDERSEGDA